MTNRFLKSDCHRMMRAMWGIEPKKVAKSYFFLKDKMGFDVHFSEIIDRKILIKIHQYLVDRMKEKGYEYNTGMKYDDLDALEKEEWVY